MVEEGPRAGCRQAYCVDLPPDHSASAEVRAGHLDQRTESFELVDTKGTQARGTTWRLEEVELDR